MQQRSYRWLAFPALPKRVLMIPSCQCTVKVRALQIERTLASRSGLLTFACFRHKSALSINALELEARVGIGRLMPYFQP